MAREQNLEVQQLGGSMLQKEEPYPTQNNNSSNDMLKMYSLMKKIVSGCNISVAAYISPSFKLINIQ
jgi:hypothetical protein